MSGNILSKMIQLTKKSIFIYFSYQAVFNSRFCFVVGITGEWYHAEAKACELLVNAGHRISRGNVNFASHC